jgi:hypothetical protein
LALIAINREAIVGPPGQWGARAAETVELADDRRAASAMTSPLNRPLQPGGEVFVGDDRGDHEFRRLGRGAEVDRSETCPHAILIKCSI